MVKRKSLPKKGSDAGFAANEAPPVLDGTKDSSDGSFASSSEENQTSFEAAGISKKKYSNEKVVKELQRPASSLAQVEKVVKPVMAKSNLIKNGNQQTTLNQKTYDSSVISGNTRNKPKQPKGKNLKNKLEKMTKSQPGVKVLQEIRKYQSTTQLLIPKAPFLRLIRELIHNRTNDTTFKITKDAVDALREASEVVLTSLFEDAYLLSLHAKRVTLMPRDLNLLIKLKHDHFLNPL